MKVKQLEWTDQQKKDFLATYEFWCWAAETGKDKEDWPEYDRIMDLDGECAFCHYFSINYGRFYCPIKKRAYCNDCYTQDCVNGLYTKWHTAIELGDLDFAKKYAKYIRNRIKKYLIKEGVLNET